MSKHLNEVKYDCDFKEVLIDKMCKRWPSEIVARTKVSEFSGGLLNSKTMANIDSMGEGPPRIRVGRKVVYITRTLAEWMLKRSNN